MKKIFARIMLIALASIMCIGLAACSHSVDAKSIKGERVTEEEWVAAIEALFEADAEYTAKYFMETTIDYSVKTMVHKTKFGYKQSISLTDVKNGNKEYLTGKDKISISGDKDYAEQRIGKARTKDIEQYREIVDGRSYVYEKGHDDEWKKEQSLAPATGIDAMKSRISYIAYNYVNYEYSSEHKGYVSKDYEEWDDNVVVYKFKDGKLVAVYYYYKRVSKWDGGESYIDYKTVSEESIIIDYSAKDITLPKVD